MLTRTKLEAFGRDILNHPVKWCVDLQRYCKFYCWAGEERPPHVCLLRGTYTNNMLSCPKKPKEVQDEVE